MNRYSKSFLEQKRHGFGSDRPLCAAACPSFGLEHPLVIGGSFGLGQELT